MIGFGQNALARYATSNLAFERYKDALGNWRWRLRAGNGRIIADSGEGYVTLAGCDHAISLIQDGTKTASVK